MEHENGGINSQSEEEFSDLRRGPWTIEEDFALINYIANHGEGRWNSLSRCAGLKRTGKSCRLRWLNYLRPDVRRGNITLEEQLLILELHSRWGNRWSKIAQHLPGRTDNEIKNYWRTRVQKHAKQLKCDVNSKQFKDAMRYLWIPRLMEKIQVASAAEAGAPAMTSSSSTSSSAASDLSKPNTEANDHQILVGAGGVYTPGNSKAAVSSDSSFGSDPMESLFYRDYNYDHHFCYGDQNMMNGPTAYYDQGLDLVDQWMDGGDAQGYFWNDDIWFLQHQFNTQ
ncbi:hypothetical protein M569_10766 [Genlisea aurea]|uniref:Uncharacterized protein n=1 Tax=Genlisea aurea TaxID=192259 RepID=S8CAY0_9LAMI|nr:hypothetical protein M569_10766 [Genlisea aurea]